MVSHEKKGALASGKIASKVDREELSEYFNIKGWNFYSDEWIKNELINLSTSGYENEVATVATKIIIRENG